jgi:hypothetical protein
MLRRESFVIALSLMFCARLTAQPHALVTVGENLAVTRGWESRPLIEPYLIAHPHQADHLVGITTVSTAAADWSREQRCATVLSVDGGRTWTQTPIDVFACGDPWLAINGDGRAILTVLGRLSDSVDAPLHLFVFTSPDGGRTWQAKPQDLGVGHDHETAIADGMGTEYIVSSQGRRDTARRVRFSVYIARRRSGAGEFEVLQRFVPSNLNLNTQGLTVLADGSLVATFTDFQRPRAPGAGAREGLLERPRTWALVFDAASPALEVPLLVSESCASGSFVASDHTAGAYRDRLYLICPDRDGTGILLHQSVDRGERWSSPRYIEPPTPRPKARTHPQVAVNKDGILGVSWLDGREDSTGHCYDLYFSASVDGGATFLQPTRVSDHSSCPDSLRNGSTFDRWPRGGDYHGLAATSDGTFHALWPDARSGVFQTMTATLRVGFRRE